MMLKRNEAPEEVRDDWFTIPNIISFMRIAMIPLFMYFYLAGFQNHYWFALGTLVLSAISDVADGIIARKFHMISKLGKALDPIADKLTQIGVMLCLLVKFPRMVVPLILIVIKEVVTGIFGLITLEKTGVVKGARWYGKLTTVLLYGMMALHLIWPMLYHQEPQMFKEATIPNVVSWVLIAACCVMMLVSFFLYVKRYINIIKAGKDPSVPETDENAETEEMMQTTESVE